MFVALIDENLNALKFEEFWWNAGLSKAFQKLHFKKAWEAYNVLNKSSGLHWSVSDQNSENKSQEQCYGPLKSWVSESIGYQF